MHMYLTHFCKIQASLGVYLKDENKLEEIVDILDELQKFTPSSSQTTKVPIPNSSEVRSLKEIACFLAVIS